MPRGVSDAAMSLAHRLGADSILIVRHPQIDARQIDDRQCDDGDALGVEEVAVVEVDLAAQLDRRFDLAWLDESVHDSEAETQRAGFHQAVQHLQPGGRVGFAVAADSPVVALGAQFELTIDNAVSTPTMRVLRRGTHLTVHDLLFAARSSISRVSAAELATRVASPEPPLVVDTRTHIDRARHGVIDGSVHVPRTVLEWHLDPSNGYRHPAITARDVPIVVVCNGGYSSSLAAAKLVQMGFTRVADLIGGMHEWCAQGYPTVAPDHSHLDLL